jgi:hypothetical protein
MLQITVHDAIIRRRAHQGATQHVRRLVINYVVWGAGRWAFFEFRAHLPRDLRLDPSGEFALLKFVIGPFQSEA